VVVRVTNKNSSPGSGGFNLGFYIAIWPTVVASVMDLAHAFHSEEAKLECINQFFVVMLPKHSTMTKLCDFRHICLQNCSLKIIAKMLTSQLQHEVPKIIDIDQTSFIKGRSISKI